MKVLLIHNEYGKYCGEEAVVDRMEKLLSENGHTVRKYTRSSAEIPQLMLGKMRAFFAAFYNPYSIREINRVLDTFRPEVVNIHNLYPFISPSVLFSIKKRGIPIVMTVHNFRLMCPTGLFMRDGLPCEACMHGGEWNCVKYNCEHSVLKSVGYALRNWIARVTGAYNKCVDRFACITDFQRQKLIVAGFDPSKIEVIPNFLDHIEEPNRIQGSYIAYSGRLSYEKGVDMIIEVARRHPEIPFVLAGEVRKERMPDGKVKTYEPNLPNVKLAGYLKGDSLKSFYQNALFLVMASRWYEGFPTTILDAASFAKPTIGPDQSGFREIINYKPTLVSLASSYTENTGILFKSLDIDDFERHIVWLWQHPQHAMGMGENAFQKLQSRYSTSAVCEKWEELLRSLTDKQACNHKMSMSVPIL